MPKFTDQIGHSIDIPDQPQRIVSLVPSQTELLHYLDLEEQVAGITKFCVHPEEWFRNKTRVGGTKKLHLDKIREISPDLIIANKEENEEAQIRELQEEFPVWTSDVKTLDDALEMILFVGKMVNQLDNASSLIRKINEKFDQLTRQHAALRVAYFIWRNPLMVAGSDTFIHEMLQKCGWQNCFELRSGRYPMIDERDLKAAQPDILMLSSEPFPFKEKHIDEFKKILPKSKVVLVDGEMFSWYGSRLLLAVDYFQGLMENLSSSSIKE